MFFLPGSRGGFKALTNETAKSCIARSVQHSTHYNLCGILTTTAVETGHECDCSHTFSTHTHTHVHISEMCMCNDLLCGFNSAKAFDLQLFSRSPDGTTPRSVFVTKNYLSFILPTISRKYFILRFQFEVLPKIKFTQEMNMKD